MFRDLLRLEYFHLELVKVNGCFKSNDYPENFINNCFKKFLNDKYRIQEKVITVSKKTLFFSPFLLWAIIIAN